MSRGHYVISGIRNMAIYRFLARKMSNNFKETVFLKKKIISPSRGSCLESKQEGKATCLLLTHYLSVYIYMKKK